MTIGKMSLKVCATFALAALAVAMPSPIAAATFTANGPICEDIARVGSTTYYSCNGSTHTSLDISNQSCSEWNHRGMLVGSFKYTLFSGCANNCANPPPNPDCNGGAGNYYVVSGATGGSSGSSTSTRTRALPRRRVTAARSASSARRAIRSARTRTRITGSSGRARARGTRPSGRRAAPAGTATTWSASRPCNAPRLSRRSTAERPESPRLRLCLRLCLRPCLCHCGGGGLHPSRIWILGFTSACTVAQVAPQSVIFFGCLGSS